MPYLPQQQHTPPPPPPMPTDIQHLFPFVERGFNESGHGQQLEQVPQHHQPTPHAPNFATKLNDVFKPISVESLSMEELQARKNYIRSHRLLPVMMELLTACKKEHILPSPDTYNMYEIAPPGTSDFGLDDFLQSQGIETNPLESDDAQKVAERQEFIVKLDQLREKYKEELDKLNRVCNEFCSRVLNLLREQSTVRPLLEQETQLKIAGIQQKFDYVRNQLRQNVCNAILVLQKQYNQVRKKRRTLPKKATEGLCNWFFEHINDPYPSEEEKSMLAAAGGLTITQVNNWFGNKRIRYKRKCLEEESKRVRMEGGVDDEESKKNRGKPKIDLAAFRREIEQEDAEGIDDE